MSVVAIMLIRTMEGFYRLSKQNSATLNWIAKYPHIQCGFGWGLRGKRQEGHATMHRRSLVCFLHKIERSREWRVGTRNHIMVRDLNKNAFIQGWKFHERKHASQSISIRVEFRSHANLPHTAPVRRSGGNLANQPTFKSGFQEPAIQIKSAVHHLILLFLLWPELFLLREEKPRRRQVCSDQVPVLAGDNNGPEFSFLSSSFWLITRTSELVPPERPTMAGLPVCHYAAAAIEGPFDRFGVGLHCHLFIIVFWGCYLAF